MTHNHTDVELFHEKFGLPAPDSPHFLPQDLLMFRIRFMVEELQEFIDSHGLPVTLKLEETRWVRGDTPIFPDMVDAADALIDLAYVVHGTAVMMGLPWQRLWGEVQRANMDKVRVESAGQSKRSTRFDCIKPEGWQPPNHLRILGHGPFPVFQPKE